MASVFEDGSIKVMAMDDYDRIYRQERRNLLVGIGWQACLHCRELIQGVYSEE